jgi:hypothetical protein
MIISLWRAFCQGAYVQGAFVLFPHLILLKKRTTSTQGLISDML